MTNSRLTDPEVLELRFPVRLESYAIRARLAAAPGGWRGGDGGVRRVRFLEPMTASILSNGRSVRGLRHGRRRAGRARRQPVERADGRVETLGHIGSAEMAAGRRVRDRDAGRRRLRHAGLKPILVTGFEPFGGDSVNPSAEVARALHGRALCGAPVIGIVLPCAFGASIDVLRAALDQHRPQLVLALGLAAGREGFTPERVAINRDDARIADNAGAQPIDRPVVSSGPAAYFSTLPIKAMVAALRDADHPAAVSNSAGTYVCNHIFYGLMHAIRRRAGVRGGFMHLCALPGQAGPSLSLAALTEGVATALVAAMCHRDADLDLGDGRLD